MPDECINIELHGALASKVRAAAEASGLTPDAWAAQTMAAWLLTWDEDLRRLEEPGENTPAEQAFAEVRARLVTHLALQQLDE
ncbi:MAG: hypothetical protein WDM79_15525 [Terricaulis sp.]